MFGDETHILHLIPSGILRDTMSILGNGVVIDLPELLKEIEELRENGVEVQGKLHVSARSHLVMPWHRLIDQLREKDKGEKKSVPPDAESARPTKTKSEDGNPDGGPKASGNAAGPTAGNHCRKKRAVDPPL